MADIMADINKRLISYSKAVRNYTAYLAEAQVCNIASQSCPSFIRSFEGGVTDCGLNTSLERLSILEADDSRARVIPIEVKNIAPMPDHKGNLYWVYTFTRLQTQHCQIVIVTAAKDPQHVALLPLYYFRKRHSEQFQGKQERVPLYSCTLRPRWLLHSMPAYPAELAPFILPIDDLGQALKDVQLYATGQVNVW